MMRALVEALPLSNRLCLCILVTSFIHLQENSVGQSADKFPVPRVPQSLTARNPGSHPPQSAIYETIGEFRNKMVKVGHNTQDREQPELNYKEAASVYRKEIPYVPWGF